MNRRKALSSLSLLGVSGLVLPSLSLTGCQHPGYIARFFPQEDLLLLDEIGETILPTTEDSSGAKAAFVGNCIDTYIADCYTPELQKVINKGIARFKALSMERYGTSFLTLSPEQRKAYLQDFNKYAHQHEETLNPGESHHFFTLLKNLVIFTYFTSEIGATQALRYVPIPGRYVGDFPYKEGDKAWAI
ncbi:MAG: gluconate 2-dehydrogenase subunit 3 family protein [Bacteroidota bacterium]